MQRALPGSVLVHAAVLGTALVGFAWPEPEDAPAAEAVSVSIVQVASVTENTTDVVQSDSTVNLVSSGTGTSTTPVLEPMEPDTTAPVAEPLPPLVAEVTEPIEPSTPDAPEPDAAEPVAAEAVTAPAETTVEPSPAQNAETLPQQSEPVQAATAAPVAEQQASAEIAALSSSALDALQSETLPTTAPPTDTPTDTTATATAEPVLSETIAPSTETAQPVTAETIAAVQPPASEPLQSAAAPTLQSQSNTEQKQAPVPRTLSFERPSQPTRQRQAQPQPQRAEPPARERPRRTEQPSRSEQPSRAERPATPRATPAGNGGRNNADAVAAISGGASRAGAGNGGEAEVARYPSEVLRKLRRALRSTNGSRGEVVVRFIVQSNGQVSGVSVGRSSGNAAVDQAGLATVRRAAPFPPIPAAAGRSQWTFDVPLAFGG